jgi:hypothetical protein
MDVRASSRKSNDYLSLRYIRTNPMIIRMIQKGNRDPLETPIKKKVTPLISIKVFL